MVPMGCHVIKQLLIENCYNCCFIMGQVINNEPSTKQTRNIYIAYSRWSLVVWVVVVVSFVGQSWLLLLSSLLFFLLLSLLMLLLMLLLLLPSLFFLLVLLPDFAKHRASYSSKQFRTTALLLRVTHQTKGALCFTNTCFCCCCSSSCYHES